MMSDIEKLYNLIMSPLEVNWKLYYQITEYDKSLRQQVADFFLQRELKAKLYTQENCFFVDYDIQFPFNYWFNYWIDEKSVSYICGGLQVTIGKEGEIVDIDSVMLDVTFDQYGNIFEGKFASNKELVVPVVSRVLQICQWIVYDKILEG